MKRINMNTLAKQVAEREGGAVSLDIAQIKEVIRVTLEVLGMYPPSQVLEAIERAEETRL